MLARAALELSKIKKYEVVVFSSHRHLAGFIEPGETLKSILRKNKVVFFSETDINISKKIDGFIDENTLGIAMGAPWIFSKDFVRKFKNPLLDFMGIDLPRYRGGAHYTWQILFGDKEGCCNLQVIGGDEDNFHKGAVIKRKVYDLGDDCKLPADYFGKAGPVEIGFLFDFLDEVKNGKEFKMHLLDESKSSYFPFLHTLSNGWINWDWTAEEIKRFISAFDDPYDGASTRINGQRAFLKKSTVTENDKNVHPFASGLVICKSDKFIKVMARGGILKIERVMDMRKRSLFSQINLGDRFMSSRNDIEKALGFKAEYTPRGLKK